MLHQHRPPSSRKRIHCLQANGQGNGVKCILPFSGSSADSCFCLLFTSSYVSVSYSLVRIESLQTMLDHLIIKHVFYSLTKHMKFYFHADFFNAIHTLRHLIICLIPLHLDEIFATQKGGLHFENFRGQRFSDPVILNKNMYPTIIHCISVKPRTAFLFLLLTVQNIYAPPSKPPSSPIDLAKK